MPQPSITTREYVGFRRSPAVPGLEVLDGEHSPRQWRDVCAGFAVTFLRTWQGTVRYRNGQHDVEPGIAFCNHPAEALIATPHGGRAGSFSVLIVAPELLRQWLSEYQAQALRPEWRAVTKPISERLVRNIADFLAAFRPQSSALAQQSAAVRVAEGMIGELVSGAANGRERDQFPLGGAVLRGVARMRERLIDEDDDADLASLARDAGLSRFQALRAFKRRYGLPPHAYQLCLRVSRARALLLDGGTPADVAAHCGFVDQSHFNRHFKRIVGVTPTQFAAEPANTSREYRIYESTSG